MPGKITVDFGGKEPMFTSGGGSDHIPPGQYTLKVESAENGQSRNGNPMVTVSFRVAKGPSQGSQVREYFTLHNDVGIRRFHGFLVAMGGSKQNGKKSIDLGQLEGKNVEARIVDDVVPATEQYAEQVRSRVGEFINKKKAAEKEPEPETADDDEAEAADSDDEGEDFFN